MSLAVFYLKQVTSFRTMEHLPVCVKCVPSYVRLPIISLCLQELLPDDSTSEFAASREQIRVILDGVTRIHRIAANFAARSHK